MIKITAEAMDASCLSSLSNQINIKTCFGKVDSFCRARIYLRVSVFVSGLEGKDVRTVCVCVCTGV